MREKFPWAKFLLGYGLYLFFHEINRLLPGTFIGIMFGEGIESVFAHMKMLFYAYLFLTIIDALRLRKTGVRASFVFSRMLILSAVPWMMIVVFYVADAAGIVLPGRLELVWALIVTAFGLYFSMRLEEPLESIEYRPSLRSMILIAFLSAVVTYFGFSFHIPDNFFIAFD